jgi:hypothetical protein
MINVTWLCAVRATNLAQLENSNLASVRLRTAVSLRGMAGFGIECIVTDGNQYSSTDLIIAGKIDYLSDPSRPMRWLSYMADGKSRGARVIIDYTDNHLGQDSPAGQFYRESLNLADGVIVSSEVLRDEVRKYFDKYIRVIEDPIEVEIIAPKPRSSKFPSALWFGHSSNLPYLISYLERTPPTSLKTLAALSNFETCPLLLERLVCAAKVSNISLNTIQWTMANVIKISKICDVSIIPAGLYDDRKKGASSNRLLTSLALGLPTAAHPINSYLEFAEYFYDLTRSNHTEFFKRFEEYQSKIAHVQKLLRSRFTKDFIGVQWADLAQSVAHTGFIPTKVE